MEANKKPKVLVVDDIETNRIILKEMLRETYDVDEAENGMEAISKLLNAIEKPSLILLDVMMPVMDGFSAIKIIKANPNLSKIPVMFITAAADEEKKGLALGAVDYILKPFDADIVQLRAATHIELFTYRESLERLVEQKAYDLSKSKETFLATMADLIEYRSLESGRHVMRTRDLSSFLIEELLKGGPYAGELININYPALIKAVPLHDIGKVAIPDDILLKPGKLTPEEFKIVETHTTVGGQVIQSLIQHDKDDKYLRHCYDICLHHHERWDGKGYPEKLSGTDIPLSARIVSLVDVYDALVTERCYKSALSHEKATEIIVDSSGTHFDPDIVDAFKRIHEQFKRYEAS